MTWKHIEISTGILSGPSRSECAGVVQLEFRNIGRRIFFVDAVEADGGKIGLHDSFSYSDAIVAAEEVGHFDNIPVHDLVVGGVA